MFLRPGGAGHVETVNDADGLLANFWRALQHAPEAVAEAADNPVNEADLHARHLWLVGQRERITERLMGEPDWFDAKAAGWWCWGLNCWIGSGWCDGNGPWQSVGGVMVNTRATEDGVSRKRPHLGNLGQGVNRQLPHLGNLGQGVNRQLPHLGNVGHGVNRKLTLLAGQYGSGGKGKNRDLPSETDRSVGECAARRAWLIEYLRGFADRLRNVRVCCGDWQRVCGPSVTFKHGLTGVFLDPPYADTAGRADGLYAVDCQQVAHAVRDWAVEQGTNPLMRIVLAGYQDEHEMPADWRVIEWEAAGGYGLQGAADSTGKANSKRERLWCSPHCLSAEPEPLPLFDGANAMNLDRWPHWVSDDGAITLVCGDSLVVLPELAAGSVDCIVTDPPYGHNNNNGDLIQRRESALGRGEHGAARAIVNDGAEANDLFRASLPLMFTALAPGCCCCCCCGGGGGPDPQFARWSLWMDEVFNFKQMVVWDKGPMGMGWHYRRSYETVLVGEKPGAACRWFGGREVENIIRPGRYGIKKIIPSATDHPTPKPVELYAHFIRLHTRTGQLVVDPFAGESPCGVACARMGRRYLGIEISGEYHADGVARIQEELRLKTGRGPLFSPLLEQTHD